MCSVGRTARLLPLCLLWFWLDGCLAVDPLPGARAVLGTYPGFQGTQQVQGWALLRPLNHGVEIYGVLLGLQAHATGGWHIHEGTTCSNASQVGGHYHPHSTTDTWANITYSSSAAGAALIHLVFPYVTFEEVVGRALVVHDSIGTRVGCGLINPAAGVTATAIFSGRHLQGTVLIHQSANGTTDLLGLLTQDGQGEHTENARWELRQTMRCSKTAALECAPLNANGTALNLGSGSAQLEVEASVAGLVLPKASVLVVRDTAGHVKQCAMVTVFTGTQTSAQAVLGTYPGYSGTLQVQGFVMVRPFTTGMGIHLVGVLAGLEHNVSGGWHIHTGTTCSNASLVGGHYHPHNTEDTWANVTYSSTTAGGAVVRLTFPYVTYDEVVGRALVVHSSAGTRVGCSLIKSVPTAPRVAPVLSNNARRLDNQGQYMDVHDGQVVQWETCGKYYWYGMGYGGCQLSRSRAACDGLLTAASAHPCGFQLNHTINIYSSSDLVTWEFEAEALPMEQVIDGVTVARPVGIYFRPKVIFNPRTKKYVLWVHHLSINSTDETALEAYPNSSYVVATSRSPVGPFRVVNPEASMMYTGGGDFDLLVTGGKAYMVYGTWYTSYQLSVEQLNDAFTASIKRNSGFVTSINHEAPAFFERDGRFYITSGHTCCFCPDGSGVSVFASAKPLGPWNNTGLDIGLAAGTTNVSFARAQQSFVLKYQSVLGSVFLWAGDQWARTWDGSKGETVQQWTPLTFGSQAPYLPRQLKLVSSIDLQDPVGTLSNYVIGYCNTTEISIISGLAACTSATQCQQQIALLSSGCSSCMSTYPDSTQFQENCIAPGPGALGQCTTADFPTLALMAVCTTEQCLLDVVAANPLSSDCLQCLLASSSSSLNVAACVPSGTTFATAPVAAAKLAPKGRSMLNLEWNANSDSSQLSRRPTELMDPAAPADDSGSSLSVALLCGAAMIVFAVFLSFRVLRRPVASLSDVFDSSLPDTDAPTP